MIKTLNLKTDLKEEDFDIMTVFELDQRLSTVGIEETYPNGKIRSFEDCCTYAMNHAFGIGWLDNEYYKAYFIYYVLPCKEAIKMNENDKVVYLYDK